MLSGKKGIQTIQWFCCLYSEEWHTESHVVQKSLRGNSLKKRGMVVVGEKKEKRTKVISFLLFFILLYYLNQMSTVSSNKNKPGRPPNSLSTNLTAVQSSESDMLSVSSRQRQSKKDEVNYIVEQSIHLIYRKIFSPRPSVRKLNKNY